MVHGTCATSRNSDYMNVNTLLVYHSDFRSKYSKLYKVERNHVIQSYKKRNEKTVYKNVSSHALKPYPKLLSFTFGTPKSHVSVLGYQKEERMIFIDF